MRILGGTIKNIGRFEHFEFKLSGPISGIMGPNGKGKSTLMRCLAFGFTGELRMSNKQERAESFVRFWGHPEKGAANGSVEINFEHEGETGTIFRQIGKSPKVWMEWAEHRGKNKITSAGGVDKVLKDIIGADKKAINEAVFIKQSELDALLFGDQASREEMFVKVLLVSHLEKVSKSAETKAIILQKEIVDNTQVLDNLRSQQREIDERLTDLVKNPVPDNSSQLSILRTWVQQLDVYDRSTAEAESIWGQITQRTESTKTQLASMGLVDYPDLPSLIVSLQEDLKKAESQKTSATEKYRDLSVRIEAKKRHDSLLQEEARLRPVVESLKKEMADIEASPEYQHHGFLDKLRADINTHSRRAFITAEQSRLYSILGTLTDEAQKNSEEMQRLGPLVEEAAVQLEPLREQMIQKRTAVDFARSLHKLCGSQCPTCHTTVDQDMISRHTGNASEAELASLVSQFNAAQKKLDDLRNEFRRASEVCSGSNKTLAAHRENLSRLETELNELTLHYPTLDNAGCQSRIPGIEANINAFNRVSHQLAIQEPALKKVVDQLAVISVEGFEGLETAHATAADEFSRHTQNVNQISNQLTLASSGQQALGDLAGRNIAAKETAERARLSMLQQEASFGPATKLAISNSGNDFRSALRLMESDQNSYQEYLGTKAAVQQQLDGIIRRITDLENIDRVNDGKRALIRDLELIKNAFSRKAIPMSYVRDRFAQLADLTRQNLSMFESNFTVEAHEETPVTFTFTRLDDDSGYVMDQEKLSGGQRVRLSICFLKAVQQLIIPNIGLLSLDEPSVHLDDSSVEQLRELLETMGRTLQNTGAQVIVCDHNKILESSFSSKVSLQDL